MDLDEIRDEMGAHISVAGGVQKAPGRAAAIGARVMQIFTKQPARWAEPSLPSSAVEAYRKEARAQGIRYACAHDSYLINLASPDPGLWRKSIKSFRAELGRAASLGLDAVVTHPGNATDGDLGSGIARNGDALAAILDDAPAGPQVLLELTAGAGTTVGGDFESLGRIRRLAPKKLRGRIGICVDTCHAWASGYDLRADYQGFLARADDAFGLDRIELFHLNDTRCALGSKRDRHAGIGEGLIGLAPFRRILRSRRFRKVPKILETPKGDDRVSLDRRNLQLLRSLRA